MNMKNITMNIKKQDDRNRKEYNREYRKNSY